MSPKEQFLHYPTPKEGVPDFADKVRQERISRTALIVFQEITVTNYTGEAREYLKKLIELLGGKFSPQLSSSRTHILIAAEYVWINRRIFHGSHPISAA